MASQSIQEIHSFIEEKTPKLSAEHWDNVGLLVGDPEWRTAGAVVSIDLTSEAIETAKKKGYHLIVTHHPPIFPKQQGLSQVVKSKSNRNASLVFDALQSQIAVITSHTNFDRCALEVIQEVSQGLKIQPMGRLIEKPEGELIKLVVFVPETHVEKVRAALCEAGAGHIGNYDYCTFGAQGEGTFRGGSDSKPFIGKSGQIEKAQEIRLETVFPRGLKQQIYSALKSSHPYEEIAYDFYPIMQSPEERGLVRGLGYGFWGEFLSSKPFSEFAKDVTQLFGVQGFRVTEPVPRQVKRVAFVAGKGSAFLDDAIASGCDLLITGEAGYHDTLKSSWRKMAVVELGHRESELFFLRVMEQWLLKKGIQVVQVQDLTQKIWSI